MLQIFYFLPDNEHTLELHLHVNLATLLYNLSATESPFVKTGKSTGHAVLGTGRHGRCRLSFNLSLIPKLISFIAVILA